MFIEIKKVMHVAEKDIDVLSKANKTKTTEQSIDVNAITM